MSEKLNSIATLRSFLEPNETIYYKVTKVSRSGMSRNIEFYWIDMDRRPSRITWLMSEALGYKQLDDGSIRVRGCGMDMGFKVISDLADALFYDYKQLRSEAL